MQQVHFMIYTITKLLISMGYAQQMCDTSESDFQLISWAIQSVRKYYMWWEVVSLREPCPLFNTHITKEEEKLMCLSAKNIIPYW
jgi:hypothetical protein